uniref:Ovule protein n=1 Tax=Romanomermis culicivorax TaxID=13658 RepID=A0A915J5H3_ROMCU
MDTFWVDAHLYHFFKPKKMVLNESLKATRFICESLTFRQSQRKKRKMKCNKVKGKEQIQINSKTKNIEKGGIKATLIL